MRLRKLKDAITAADDVDITAAENEETFAELIQFLDDKSLALVMRDARDDGRKALKILQAHYAGTGKPRVISLYTELTSQKNINHLLSSLHSDKDQKFSEFKVALRSFEDRDRANQCNDGKSLCDEDGIQEGIPVRDRLLSVRPRRAHCSLL